MKSHGWTPWLFIAPALFILGFFLVYPTLDTIYLSFFDSYGIKFVGPNNYLQVFQNYLPVMRNNLMWLIVVPAMTVSLGLAFAVLFDRVHYEAFAKSVIFLPMAISFVGASVIWKFVYTYVPPSSPQIGILNAFVKALGFEPMAWLIKSPWINNLALMVVFIWIWTGYCMVILSAAYKGIDRDMLDAARTDGANEWQVFWYVAFPTLRSTIIVVLTTMIVFVLKIFDIVYVMTNGSFNTEVLANLMYKMYYTYNNTGLASAVAVLLLIAVMPFIILNIRRFAQQEAVR